MFIISLLTLILQIMFVFGAEPTIEDVKEACEDVKNVDEYLCDLVKTPRPYNGEKIFPAIEQYIKCFERLSTCLDTRTNLTLELCSDVFDEQGAQFMHIRFDWDDLVNGFQWNEEGMEEYEMWRGRTLDAWLKCEKHIYKHISF